MGFSYSCILKTGRCATEMMGKMAEYDKTFLLGLCNTMAMLATTGCQTPPPKDVSQPSPQPIPKAAAAQQLIIKFKPDTIACNAAGIAHLASATRVPLEYVRPMSGNACVIRQVPDGADDLFAGKELLRQHPAVEWLEQDAKKAP